MKRSLNKFFSLILCLVLCACFCACSKPASEQSETTPPTEKETIATETSEAFESTKTPETTKPTETEKTTENTTEKVKTPQKSSSSTQKAKKTLTHDEKIEKIRDSYYTTQNELGQYNKKVFGTSATAYFNNGSLCMLDEYPEYNPEIDGYSDGEKEKFFYYEDDELYFTLLVDANTRAEDRLYFYDGQLIRWIDSSSTTYDDGAQLKQMQKWYDYAMEKYNDVCLHHS